MLGKLGPSSARATLPGAPGIPTPLSCDGAYSSDRYRPDLSEPVQPSSLQPSAVLSIQNVWGGRSSVAQAPCPRRA
jgi:hypothetical protein